MRAISKTKATLLCFFFGIIGLHRLRMGYKNWWIMPMTFGGFLFWSLTDLMRILAGKMPMADGTPLKS